MKKFRMLINSVLLVAVVLSLALTACGSKSPIAEHDKLVTLYWEAVNAQKMAGGCFDTNRAKVQATFKVYEMYLTTEVDRVSEWRAQVREANEAYAAQRKAYNQANASAGDDGVVDLQQMVENQATPADLYKGLSLEIYAVTEAPLATLPPDIAAQQIDVISEAADTNFRCIDQWNKAATAYNTERNRLNSLTNSGEIIGALANKIGVNELPASLPYYEAKVDDASTFFDD